MNIWEQLIVNRVLITCLIAWFLAQFLKVPINYLLFKRVRWSLWFSTGGMPSSHSALVTSVSIATGLYAGFDSAVFALSLALAMVVVYDAAGIRRQAGMHAERINDIIDELFKGQPPSEKELKEVLGHTPVEVIGGIGLGIFVALMLYLIWS